MRSRCSNITEILPSEFELRGVSALIVRHLALPCVQLSQLSELIVPNHLSHASRRFEAAFLAERNFVSQRIVLLENLSLQSRRHVDLRCLRAGTREVLELILVKIFTFLNKL